MSYSWKPIKEYMLSKPVRWYDIDGKILFANWYVSTISTRALAYIVEIDEINEKFFCLCIRISPIDPWDKLIDLVVNEFLEHKTKYEMPWSTLDGGLLPEPIGIKFHYNEETDTDEYTIQ